MHQLDQRPPEACLRVAFLNRAVELDRGDLPLALRSEPTILKAVVQLEHIGLDVTERALYEAEEKATMIGRIEIETAKTMSEKQGLQRGLQQGLQQGLQELLFHQMTGRFGEVPADITARVNCLSASELRELGLALFDIRSYGDVESWLARHASSTSS